MIRQQKMIRLQTFTCYKFRCIKNIQLYIMADRLNLLQIRLSSELNSLRQAGTYKHQRVITSPQGDNVVLQDNLSEALNFCSNNYLGFSNHPKLIQAAKNTLDSHGFGMSSVRFICGTQDIHKKLEKTISQFFKMQDTILFPSAFDANAGFFQPLFGPQDMIISDTLIHASLIDGIRLCKAKKQKYNHLDMNDLEKKLKLSENARVRVIVTDGVFSMDGDIAPLDKIYLLAKKYNAYIFLDDCHGTGAVGKTGRGTPEIFNLEGKIDFISSTLGKAMGGASGGFVSASKNVVDLLRNKARTYLFTNSVAPPLVGAAIEAFKLIDTDKGIFGNLQYNTTFFRQSMVEAGFKIMGHPQSPISPVWLGDAKIAQQMSRQLLAMDIYVIGFSYPVVPKDQARIRVQLSGIHTKKQVHKCIEAFVEIGQKMKIIP